MEFKIDDGNSLVLK